MSRNFSVTLTCIEVEGSEARIAAISESLGRTMVGLSLSNPEVLFNMRVSNFEDEEE